ncbi:hypothetical protein DL768_005741 [Monosporascus sp. mg162]|nr:hypothetical protein DL768_005741 [Monosporascus sp. mg162]
MLDSPDLSNLTGEEIAALAYAEPPIHPTGLGPVIVALMCIFTILATVVVAGRVWARSWYREADQKWGADDYLAVMGFLPFIPAAVFGVLAAKYGVGARDADVNDLLKIRAREYVLMYQLLYYTSSIITKLAIGLTILRICIKRRYKYIIWTNLALMFIIAGGSTVYVLTDCQPFATHWNPALGGEFGFLVISYLGTSTQVATDWTCAITPFFVVKDLQMKRRVKISVICILGLGIFASIAALMRIIMYQYTDRRKYPDDELYNQAPLLIWSEVEGGFAIIASSLPALRKMFGKFYRDSSDRSKAKTNSPGSTKDGNTIFRTGTQLATLTPQGKSLATVTSGGHWDRLSDDSSHKHIIKQTEVRVDETGRDDIETCAEDWREEYDNRVST